MLLDIFVVAVLTPAVVIVGTHKILKAARPDWFERKRLAPPPVDPSQEIGRASCRERVSSPV